MSSSDWEEIKRLASDFEKAQLSTSLQRLSEGNCVEIINKLLELHLVEIFPTTDAKDYITPEQVTKEIEDELYLAGGRIDITKLSALLNVDYSVIENKSTQLAASSSSISLVLGELVTEYYLDGLAEEVNEKLQQNGSVKLGSLSRDYDLPVIFLQTALSRRVGHIIRGEQDEIDQETFFTEGFVSRHKHQVRGILSGITKPTSVGSLINANKLQERLFYQFAEQLISSGAIAGSLSGARNARMGMYTPNIYSQVQYDWTSNFLKQNGYIEYESLKRLGLTDPQMYVKKHFADQKLTYTSAVCIGKTLVDQIETMIEDAIVSSEFVDIYPYVPSSFSPDVCKNLIDLALENRESNAKASGYTNPSTCHVFCDSMVVSDTLLTKTSLQLETFMPDKAQELIKSGAFKQRLSSAKAQDLEPKNKKDERRKKAAGGKAGGGTQGRETKTKSTKKMHHKNKKQKESDSEDECDSNDFEFLTKQEIQEKLLPIKEFENCPEELLEEISVYMYGPLKNKFQELAQASFQSALADGGQSRKKTFKQLEENLLALLTTIRLGTKGLKMFDEDLQTQLSKYLIRSQCTSLVDELVKFLADDSLIKLDKEGSLAPETRLKIINKMSEESRESLLEAHKMLTQNSIDDCLVAAEDAIAAAGILIKKKDNKKDRNVLLNHRYQLLEQLNATDNAALVLHVVCLILFQVITGNMIHASGKFVPQILSFLQVHLPQEFCDVLDEYRDLVMKSFSGKQSDSDSRLLELTSQIKTLAASFKKAKDSSISED